MKENWQKIDKPFSEYPIGTKARISWERGGWWTKTEKGWKWCVGATFPVPGNADEISLPDKEGIICG
jgi:hypothetical protein